MPARIEHPVPIAPKIPSPKPQSTIRAIQVLRGIAALMVLVGHLGIRTPLQGAVIDLFFVISGFIMGIVGQHEPAGLFIKKRVARLVPLYWLVTIAMCVGGSLGLFHHFTYTASTLLMSLLFIPFFDAQGHMFPLLVQGWTLDYDIIFYGVFALGLYLKRPIVTTMAVLIPLTVLGAILHPTSAIAQVWTAPINLEFIGGLLLARIRHRLPGPAIGTLLMVAGISAVVMSDPVRLALGGEYRLLTWGIPTLLFTAGILAVEFGGYWPAKLTWPIQIIGDWSYSLYLVHGFVIALGHRLLGTSLLSTAIIFAGSIAVSRLVFILAEKPLATWALALVKPPAGKAQLAAA